MSFTSNSRASALQMVSNTYIRFFTMDKVSFYSWEAYVILGLIFFIQNYHFKLGYFASILENQGTIYEKESEMEE